MTEEFKENNSEPDHAHHIKEEHNRAFRVLYDTIIDVEATKGKDVFQTLCSNLRRISNAKAVFFGKIFPEKGLFILKAADFRQENMPPIQDYVLTKPIGIPAEIVDLLKKNHLEECNDPINCLGQEFFQEVYQPYESLLGSEMFRFICQGENRPLGMGVIIADEGLKLEPLDIIKIYLNLSGIILHRVESIAQLKESEENLKIILESIPAGVLLIDSEELKIIKANSSAEAMIGVGEGELSNESCDKVFCQSKGRCPIRDFAQPTEFSEKILKKKNGEDLPVLKSVVSVNINGRKIFIESFIDISARKKGEKMIAAEKEQLAVTLRSIGDGVITVDRDKKVLLINKAAEDLTGWRQEDVAGRFFDEVFRLEDPQTTESINYLLDDVINLGSNRGRSEGLLVSKDGSKILINDSVSAIRDINNNIIGSVLVFRDISDTRRMEDELFKKRKLESLGILAGGIAHDFNNILAVIVSQIAVAKIETCLDDKLFEILREIEQQALRAKGLTHQLMTFSKGGAPIKKVSSVKEIIPESAKFVLHGSNVKSEFDIPNNLWSVVVDKGQFNQVIQNIVMNAQQAMEHGGIVTIKAENVNIDKGSSVPVTSGKYVKISIRDEGAGISHDIQDKIFDPYFTTKQEGSGLGLATVFSIVKRHEGCVTVSSEIEKGAAFQIYLPALGGNTKEQIITDNEPLTGTGKILLMDDEEALRDSVALILHKFGYTVETAINGEAAIDKYILASKTSHPFDILILDLTVKAGLGGKDTISRVKKINPDVKAIAISGYSDGPVMESAQEFGFQTILIKPFAIEELIKTIKKYL